MEVLRNNKLAENLLHLALAQGASDMHIEPDGQGVRVRIPAATAVCAAAYAAKHAADAAEGVERYGYCRKKSAAGWASFA